MQEDVRHVSPSHVKLAGAHFTYNNSAYNRLPAASKVSVYRALQLHDQDSPQASLAGVMQQDEASIDLPCFQTLHATEASQGTVAEDAFAVGLEQRPLADPDVHHHLLQASHAQAQGHSPTARPIQEQHQERPFEQQVDSPGMAHQPAIASLHPQHLISARTQHERTAEIVQPVPAYAWSMEQLTAIASAAATAAAMIASSWEAAA